MGPKAKASPGTPRGKARGGGGRGKGNAGRSVSVATVSSVASSSQEIRGSRSRQPPPPPPAPSTRRPKQNPEELNCRKCQQYPQLDGEEGMGVPWAFYGRDRYNRAIPIEEGCKRCFTTYQKCFSHQFNTFEDCADQCNDDPSFNERFSKADDVVHGDLSADFFPGEVFQHRFSEIYVKQKFCGLNREQFKSIIGMSIQEAGLKEEDLFLPNRENYKGILLRNDDHKLDGKGFPYTWKFGFGTTMNTYHMPRDDQGYNEQGADIFNRSLKSAHAGGHEDPMAAKLRLCTLSLDDAVECANGVREQADSARVKRERQSDDEAGSEVGGPAMSIAPSMMSRFARSMLPQSLAGKRTRVPTASPQEKGKRTRTSVGDSDDEERVADAKIDAVNLDKIMSGAGNCGYERRTLRNAIKKLKQQCVDDNVESLDPETRSMVKKYEAHERLATIAEELSLPGGVLTDSTEDLRSKVTDLANAGVNWNSDMKHALLDRRLRDLGTQVAEGRIEMKSFFDVLLPWREESENDPAAKAISHCLEEGAFNPLLPHAKEMDGSAADEAINTRSRFLNRLFPKLIGTVDFASADQMFARCEECCEILLDVPSEKDEVFLPELQPAVTIVRAVAHLCKADDVEYAEDWKQFFAASKDKHGVFLPLFQALKDSDFFKESIESVKRVQCTHSEAMADLHNFIQDVEQKQCGAEREAFFVSEKDKITKWFESTRQGACTRVATTLSAAVDTKLQTFPGEVEESKTSTLVTEADGLYDKMNASCAFFCAAAEIISLMEPKSPRILTVVDCKEQCVRILPTLRSRKSHAELLPALREAKGTELVKPENATKLLKVVERMLNAGDPESLPEDAGGEASRIFSELFQAIDNVLFVEKDVLQEPYLLLEKMKCFFAGERFSTERQYAESWLKILKRADEAQIKSDAYFASADSAEVRVAIEGAEEQLRHLTITLNGMDVSDTTVVENAPTLCEFKQTLGDQLSAELNKLYEVRKLDVDGFFDSDYSPGIKFSDVLGGTIDGTLWSDQLQGKRVSAITFDELKQIADSTLSQLPNKGAMKKRLEDIMHGMDNLYALVETFKLSKDTAWHDDRMAKLCRGRASQEEGILIGLMAKHRASPVLMRTALTKHTAGTPVGVADLVHGAVKKFTGRALALKRLDQ